MSDLEAPWESTLFEAEQARVGDFIQSAVTKDLDKWFVVGDYHEVVATLCKVACLF